MSARVCARCGAAGQALADKPSNPYWKARTDMGVCADPLCQDAAELELCTLLGWCAPGEEPDERRFTIPRYWPDDPSEWPRDPAA